MLSTRGGADVFNLHRRLTTGLAAWLVGVPHHSCDAARNPPVSVAAAAAFHDWLVLRPAAAFTSTSASSDDGATPLLLTPSPSPSFRGASPCTAEMGAV